MSHQQLVRSGSTEFFVEVTERTDESLLHHHDGTSVPFEGVRETIEEIGRSLTHAWDEVKPDEASVEFGLKLTAKPGKLTGILVEGGGEATLDIKLTWKTKAAPSDAATSQPG